MDDLRYPIGRFEAPAHVDATERGRLVAAIETALSELKRAVADLNDSLHSRWVTLMHAMEPAQWARAFCHPERGRLRLDQALALYAWHGRHHVAHIQRERKKQLVSAPHAAATAPQCVTSTSQMSLIAV
jgi:hypothetical protein